MFCGAGEFIEDRGNVRQGLGAIGRRHEEGDSCANDGEGAIDSKRVCEELRRRFPVLVLGDVDRVIEFRKGSNVLEMQAPGGKQ
jgi:hypothetical protein